MKNYISRAKSHGVHIYTSLSEDKYISKYTNNLVSISDI